MQLQNEIEKTGEEIMALLREILKVGPMIRGSFTMANRKCGKPTCWCAQPGAAGHPYARITWKQDGVSRTKTIPQRDLDRIREMALTYRTYRQMRRKFRERILHLETLIDKYEELKALEI